MRAHDGCALPAPRVLVGGERAERRHSPAEQRVLLRACDELDECLISASCEHREPAEFGGCRQQRDFCDCRMQHRCILSSRTELLDEHLHAQGDGLATASEGMPRAECARHRRSYARQWTKLPALHGLLEWL